MASRPPTWRELLLSGSRGCSQPARPPPATELVARSVMNSQPPGPSHAPYRAPAAGPPAMSNSQDFGGHWSDYCTQYNPAEDCTQPATQATQGFLNDSQVDHGIQERKRPSKSIVFLSLERYATLFDGLTQGDRSGTVQTFSSLDENKYSRSDLKQVLALHGLAEPTKNTKKDTLHAMVGMQLVSPFHSSKLPLNPLGMECMTLDECEEHLRKLGWMDSPLADVEVIVPSDASVLPYAIFAPQEDMDQRHMAPLKSRPPDLVKAHGESFAPHLRGDGCSSLSRSVDEVGRLQALLSDDVQTRELLLQFVNSQAPPPPPELEHQPAAGDVQPVLEASSGPLHAGTHRIDLPHSDLLTSQDAALSPVRASTSAGSRHNRANHAKAADGLAEVPRENDASWNQKAQPCKASLLSPPKPEKEKRLKKAVATKLRNSLEKQKACIAPGQAPLRKGESILVAFLEDVISPAANGRGLEKLAAGLHVGKLKRALKQTHDKELCAAACQELHEFYFVEFDTRSPNLGRPPAIQHALTIELKVDLHPRNRLNTWEAWETLINCGSHKLEDCWMNVTASAALHPPNPGAKKRKAAIDTSPAENQPENVKAGDVVWVLERGTKWPGQVISVAGNSAEGSSTVELFGSSRITKSVKLSALKKFGLAGESVDPRKHSRGFNDAFCQALAALPQPVDTEAKANRL